MNDADRAPNETAAREMEDRVRQSGSSFYWAMRLLPEEKRAAMFAIYAFCREVDDIADGDGTPEEKRAKLQAWRGEIDALVAGRPNHRVASALLQPMHHFGLEKDDFIAVIEGMEIDSVPRLRIADMRELLEYCDHVACAVGRLSTRVFGVEQQLGLELAKALGEALQLTNILRDIEEDAERDHVYLPADLLQRYGLEPDDTAAMLSHQGLVPVCREIAELAEQRFVRSRELIRQCDAGDVRPATIMLHVYYRLLQKLKRRSGKNALERSRLSKFKKLLIALRIFMFSGR